MKRVLATICILFAVFASQAQEFDDPIATSDWNTVWRSSFLESLNAANAPEPTGWFWGLNMNHRSNSTSNRYNGQIAIKNASTTPTMYFRSTTSDGTGVWTKVIHDHGDQSLNGNFVLKQAASGFRSFDVVNRLNTTVARLEATLDKSGQMWLKDASGNYHTILRSNNLPSAIDGELVLGEFASTSKGKTLWVNGDSYISGNTGIGISTPSAKLHVKADGITSSNGSQESIMWLDNGRQKLHFKAVRTANESEWKSSTFKIQALIDNTDHQSIDFTNDGNYQEHIDLFTGNQLFNTRFSANGRVGIGTDNPTAKLHVNGDILTSEVRVSTDAANVPDYVFKSDYKLTSLEEVEAYIQKESHLPEVPSAEEMEANGHNLAEMNLLLLKKIEELTLYTIQLKRENQSIRNDFAQQLKKITEEIEQLKNENND